MKELYLQPTPVAQWHALVNEAQLGAAIQLDEELESYLVFMLMRFVDRPAVSNSVIAIEFLESIHKLGSDRTDSLQEVGDKCLLLSGFFPEQVERRRLKESYYIDLGQNAYYALASISHLTVAELYQNLSEGFIMLRDVMQSMRPQTDDLFELKQQARILEKPSFKIKRPKQ